MAYTGSCLCGGVTFRIDGELDGVQVCYCAQCRKAQGGPLATNVPVAESMFTLDDGGDLLRTYESTPGKFRVFCGRCGSPVLSRRNSVPGVVRVRAGLINEPLKKGLARHAFVGSKCGWWPIQADGLPRNTGPFVPSRET